MPHGHTRIASRGVCIYCGTRGVELLDEHVVPFSLGGVHILEDASCRRCAAITSRFEGDVARDMWGHARNSYNLPSRRKSKRKPYILLSDPAHPAQRVKVPYADYPAMMMFYKMGRAGLLEGLPDTVDISNAWQMVAPNDVRAKTFQQRFGVPLTARVRQLPESFARLLAKIGYCNLLTILDPGDFRPICLPYILGERKNPSHVVGGALEIAESEAVGYKLDVVGFGSPERMMLVTEIRLFANVGTPTYHVVVGDVIGNEKVAAMLTKAEGMITVEPVTWPAAAVKQEHWMPRIWPLPFWANDDAQGVPM